MAGDWTVYWVTSAFGLMVLGGVLAMTLAVWRLTLGDAFDAVGIRPLAHAYLCAALGLVLMNFVACHLDFSARVASGLLSESQRWAVVPGWTVYASCLMVVIVLPLLGFVGVPVAAAFLRRARLTPRNIALCLLLAWLALSGLAWAFPANEWHRTHRLASLISWAQALLPAILCIALPFMLAVYAGSRTYRRQGLVQ